MACQRVVSAVDQSKLEGAIDCACIQLWQSWAPLVA